MTNANRADIFIFFSHRSDQSSNAKQMRLINSWPDGFCHRFNSKSSDRGSGELTDCTMNRARHKHKDVACAALTLTHKQPQVRNRRTQRVEPGARHITHTHAYIGMACPYTEFVCVYAKALKWLPM